MTKSSMDRVRAFSLSFNLASISWCRGEGGAGRANHLVKVFCCTLIHCFSTVNMFTVKTCQGRLARQGSRSTEGCQIGGRETVRLTIEDDAGAGFVAVPPPQITRATNSLGIGTIAVE